MAKLPVCPYCKQIVDNNTPSKKYQNRTYHTQCYHKMCTEVYEGTKRVTSPLSSNNKPTPEERLYEYICKIFCISELTGLISNQLKSFYKEYNYTYDGILYTLKYFYEIKDNKPDIKYGIGIVPLVYREAESFYKTNVKIQKQIEKTDVSKKEKTVNIKITPKPRKELVDIDKL